MTAKFETDKDLNFKRGPEILFTFFERRRKGKYVRAGRDTRSGENYPQAYRRVPDPSQFELFSQDISFAHGQPVAA
jgi:hypothetical protein